MLKISIIISTVINYYETASICQIIVRTTLVRDANGNWIIKRDWLNPKVNYKKEEDQFQKQSFKKNK